MGASPPALELTPAMRALLESRGGDLVARAERFMASAPRRCTFVTSERVSAHPTRRGWLGRALGMPRSRPVLGPLQSKFGGRPYHEEPLDWSEAAFLGQLNFAELPSAPSGAPERGILGLDTDPTAVGVFRLRWYASPAEDRALPKDGIPTVGKWEVRMRFHEGWSVPAGKALDPLRPEADDIAVWTAWNEWAPPGYGEPSEGCHQILGHRSAGLDEHSGFQPRPGRSDRIEDYEMLWRITYDNAAGFHWGTNWVYVIIHRDDLASGRIGHAIVTVANY
jgi:hypothetical protein